MRVVFDHKRIEAKNIFTFYFKPTKRFYYLAGQYIELTLKHENTDAFGDRRFFTISSSPNDELISITSKFTSQDSSSFKRVLRNLKTGTILEMTGPIGDFVLPKDITKSLIFVAGGIGITPFHSILKWLGEVGEKRHIKALYAVNSEEDIIFQHTFERIDIEPTIVVSNPSPAWKGKIGYLTPDLILETEHPTQDSLIYISGPDAMVDILRKGLLERGIKPEQLALDRFLGYRASY